VNSNSFSKLDPQYPDALGEEVLTIALIGPDESRRNAAFITLSGCRG